MMKISCSTSAFKGTLREALIEISGTGIKYTDLIAIGGWNHILPPKLAEEWDKTASEVVGLLEETKLTASAINFAVAHPYIREEEKVQQRKKECDAVARLMKHLGAKAGSFYPGYKNEEMSRREIMDNTLASLHEMYEIAGKYGVTFLIEPHFDTPFQTLAQVNELLTEMPELSVAYDPSHFAMQGIDLRSTEKILERAVHVHMRDAGPAKMQMPLGQGTVDFKWMVDALKARNYDGFLSIEYLPGLKDGVVEEIVKTRKLLESLL